MAGGRHRNVIFGSLATLVALTLSACYPVAPPPPSPTGGSALDAFERVVTGGWGSADAGGPWAVSGGAWRVDGGQGRVAVSPGAVAAANLAATPSRDADARAVVSIDRLPAGGETSAALLVRRRPTGEEYRAQLRVDALGGLHLGIVRRLGGDEAVIGAEQPVGSPVVAGGRVAVRVEATGVHPTVLRAKAWPAGSAEPSAWAVTTYDGTPTLQRAGTAGLRFAVGAGVAGGALTWSADDLGVGNAAPRTVSFGAAPLGSTSYAIPAGAIFVSPSGSDGASGSAAAPLRTLGAAVGRAPSGSTIVLRGGTYREAVTWWAKQLTIQAHPGEQVWLNGADVVTGWVRDGSAWRKDGWTVELDRSPRPDAYNPEAPLSTAPDMTFVDGVPLRQVGDRGSVGPGTFFADPAADRLYIGSDPTGRTVESSSRPWGIWVNQGHGSVVRGIGLERYGSSLNDLSALRAFANDLVIENTVLRQNAAAATAVIGSGTVLRANSLLDNGQLGISVHTASAVTIEGNRVAGNNTERFRLDWGQGGMKVTDSNDVTIRGNLFERNQGTGVWFDIDSHRNRVVRNVVRDNLDTGIQYEISTEGVIASNTVARNGGAGILVIEATGVDIFNNTLHANRDIKIIENDRPQDVADVVVRNNLSSDVVGGTDAMFIVEDVTRARTAEAMGVSFDYDHYHRSATTPPPRFFAIWANYPGTAGCCFYDAASFTSDTGQERHGSESRGPDRWFVDRAGGDLRLRTGTPVLGQATPLPASVAAALGVPPLSPVDPGAF